MIHIALPVAIPRRIEAVQHIPVSVVPMDIPTRWIRTCLAPGGRVDCLNVGTCDMRMYRNAFLVLVPCP